MPPESNRSTTTKVVVATTVALSFISFWRAAAIVLSDLASSAFYAGGIAEHAIGKSAPWFILAVMLFSFAVRSVYMESSSMFVRGGVYVVVRDAMGPLRGPALGLLADLRLHPHRPHQRGQRRPVPGPPAQRDRRPRAPPGRISTRTSFAAGFGVLVTVYFWWSNIKGIHESSGKALRIMQITTVMVVVFLIWCPITMLLRRTFSFRPLPCPRICILAGIAGLVPRHHLPAISAPSRSSSPSATPCSP